MTSILARRPAIALALILSVIPGAILGIHVYLVSSRARVLKRDALSQSAEAPHGTLIQTTPPGAGIYVIDGVIGKSSAEWIYLGRSPLKTDRVPHNGWIRAMKNGYQPAQSALAGEPVINLGLSPELALPPEKIVLEKDGAGKK